jgi:hypothetical protein
MAAMIADKMQLSSNIRGKVTSDCHHPLFDGGGIFRNIDAHEVKKTCVIRLSNICHQQRLLNLNL